MFKHGLPATATAAGGPCAGGHVVDSAWHLLCLLLVGERPVSSSLVPIRGPAGGPEGGSGLVFGPLMQLAVQNLPATTTPLICSHSSFYRYNPYGGENVTSGRGGQLQVNLALVPGSK